MYNGISNLSAVLGGAINGKTRQDAFTRETKDLANFDYLQAGTKSREASAEQSIAQAMRERAHARLYGAQADTAKTANDLHADPANYAPMMAARGGVPLELAQSFVQSLTKGGARPEVAPDVGNQLSELFASLSGLRFAGKGTGGEDIPGVLAGSLRNAAGRSAVSQAPTNPIQAAWNMSLANNKDEPKLYAANGEQGVYNTLTGEQTASSGAPKSTKPVYDPVRGMMVYPDTGTAKPVVSGGAPIGERTATPRQVYDATRGVMVDTGTGTASPVTGPDGAPVGAKDTSKAMPASSVKALEANRENLRIAQAGLDLLNGKTVNGQKGDRNATGWKNYLGSTVNQWFDEKGVPTRAMIANLGSMIIHDRSGAAVTVSEYPRLRPFIPLGTDQPDVARTKLKQFVGTYASIISDTVEFNKELGYRVPEKTLKEQPGPKTPATGSGYGGYSEDQVQATMKAHGKTREEVIRAIDAKGKRPKT